mmetsp:Transcript_13511/g.13717  ORF Transcript_13511/g.13717 Transcript_13511/m.13717 type:complete len:97 (+) Transcript_13511:690-980(+)
MKINWDDTQKVTQAVTSDFDKAMFEANFYLDAEVNVDEAFTPVPGKKATKVPSKRTSVSPTKASVKAAAVEKNKEVNGLICMASATYLPPPLQECS